MIYFSPAAKSNIDISSQSKCMVNFTQFLIYTAITHVMLCQSNIPLCVPLDYSVTIKEYLGVFFFYLINSFINFHMSSSHQGNRSIELKHDRKDTPSTAAHGWTGLRHHFASTCFENVVLMEKNRGRWEKNRL